MDEEDVVHSIQWNTDSDPGPVLPELCGLVGETDVQTDMWQSVARGADKGTDTAEGEQRGEHRLTEQGHMSRRPRSAGRAFLADGKTKAKKTCKE